jgi:hypothetical protein
MDKLRIGPSLSWGLNMLWSFRALAAVLVLAALPAAPAVACTAEDFSNAVDGAGADLRAFNLTTAPKLQGRMAELKARKGWGDSDDEDMARDYIADARMAAFDKSANELLDKIDNLGRVDAGAAPDCSKLDDLKAASVELLAVMKAKSQYALAKIDAEIGKAPAAAGEPAATATKQTAPPAAPGVPAKTVAAAPVPPPTATAGPAKEAAARVTAPDKQKDVKPVKEAKSAAPRWNTETEVAAATPPSPAPTSTPAGPQLPSDALMEPGEGYSIEEIQDATRGVFGTVSTGLGSVLEHAFSAYGRPSAYVLGKEGGGAFLAGVRYGSGTLYLRHGGTREVYWHGPSLGYDFGAAGSRTLFLIYGLNDPEAIFRSYTGLDGSAYVVGGIGLTVLKGGPVIMTPIRSGVGLRVGANVGYVRFTREKSWNPF